MALDREQRKQLVRLLKRYGFDHTVSYRSGSVYPRCSQCQALVINGVASHEMGCPNIRRVRKGR